MRNALLPSLVLILVGACSDSKSTNNNTPDAPAQQTDAATADATPPVTPDVTAYCTDIIAHCTGANAQYPTTNPTLSMNQCLGTAATFPVGTINDSTGNTLGCRQYHAGAPAMSDPATHCIHAGPGGDQVDKAGTCGDACTSFCTLQTKTCGTTEAPLPNIAPQYQNMAACMTACGTFDKTHLYTLNSTPVAPSGNSLACRLYHATNAAYYTKLADVTNTALHCTHTAETPTGPCASATPTP
jgi:hypothetical protein